MALGRIERESAHLSELALSCSDLRGFQVGLFELLKRTVGFDKAVLNAYCVGAGEDIRSRGYDKKPSLGEGPRYVAELEPQELAAVCRGVVADVDLLSSTRRNQLSMYRCCLRPEKITTFALVMWRTGNGVYGINFARTGRGARFLARELRTIERLMPMIRVTNALVRQRIQEAPSFDDWASAVGLSTKERAVTGLVVRGLQNPEIGETLSVSPNTIRNHLRSIFRKAQVTTRTELVASTFESPTRSTAKPPPWMSFVP